MDISNGPGIRVSLFTQGCDKHCKGCFNPETWDFKGGKEYTTDTSNEILKLCDQDWIAGLSILGGEPLAPENITEVAKLCVKFKLKYPDKTIWIWTGYTWEQLKKFIVGGQLSSGPDGFYSGRLDTILDCADVIVEGPFIESEKDLSLKWRGSRNQRIYGKIHKMDASGWYDITDRYGITNNNGEN